MTSPNQGGFQWPESVLGNLTNDELEVLVYLGDGFAVQHAGRTFYERGDDVSGDALDDAEQTGWEAACDRLRKELAEALASDESQPEAVKEWAQRMMLALIDDVEGLA